MWSWFSGGGTQRRKDGPKNAILLLRQQLDMLQKREKHLENQMNEQEAIARKNLATNKAGTLKRPHTINLCCCQPYGMSFTHADRESNLAAKTALRRKKVHERSLQQTSDQINQVEQQIYSIESANINQETLNAMKTAGKAMKEIHGNLTIDKVDATMYAILSILPRPVSLQKVLLILHLLQGGTSRATRAR